MKVTLPIRISNSYHLFLRLVTRPQIFFIASAGDRCNDQGTEWECNISSSYFQSFAKLLTTNFEFLDWKPVNWQQTAISFCFAIVVGILLLNILIAQISNVFTEVTDESQTAFWPNRLEFVAEVNAIMRIPIMRKLIPEGIVHPEEKGSRRPLGAYEEEWVMKCYDENMTKDFFMWWYYTWKMRTTNALLSKLDSNTFTSTDQWKI